MSTVTSEAELNAAIYAAETAIRGSFTISLGNSIIETFTLDAISLQPGVTLTIDGQGHALDGAGMYRGFVAVFGSLTLENLLVSNTLARGGNGGAFGAGGGAGLGGGLFVAGVNFGVASSASVTLNNVSFTGDVAAGGSGNGSLSGQGGGFDGGGGGGLGGNGGSVTGGGQSGGGGGGGIGGDGGASGSNGGTGIVLEAGGGGGGANSVSSPMGVTAGFGSSGGGGGGGGQNLGASGGGGGGLYGAMGVGQNGGNGGFGGGGGGGGGIGGNGGFGGGGGGNRGNGGFGGGGAFLGTGGFGAGSGASPAAFVVEGGGGLGAGGAVFVQQGGSLTIDGGYTMSDSATGGAGGAVFGYTTPASAKGSAYGAGIFLQGNQVLAFNEADGNGTTITDAITDQSGSGGTGSNAGSGSLTLTGPGFLKLAGNDSYTGGTTVNSGTLLLPGYTSAGTGAITFANQGPSTIFLDVVPSPGGALLPNAVLGFGAGDAIGELSFAYAPDASAVLSGQTLLVSSGGRSGTISLPDAVAGTQYQVSAGIYGGIVVTIPTNTTVTTEAGLKAAIDAADAAVGGSFRINLAGNITETFTLDAVNLHAGVILTIDGQGHTLDGAGAYRGLFAYAGALTIQNLQIDHTVALGGRGGFVAGGGGAGLGGGLFVTGSNAGLNSGASVTLNNVTFVGDSAAGGAGSNVGGSFKIAQSGGGGGLGGNGGNGSYPSNTGGGGGIGADGSSGAGVAGIVPGAAGGGAGAFIPGPNAQQPGGANGGSGGGTSPFGGGGGGGGVGGTVGRLTITGPGQHLGGDGGFGGGGGAGNGNGGFGGGGGDGGNGGFGGGGGEFGTGGFGGGDGIGQLEGNPPMFDLGTGGGGLGAGGAIFVQQGGSLTISGGIMALNTVTGGAAGTNPGFSPAIQGQGSAFGGAIFLQGNQTLVFNEAAGNGTTITDAITDQSGSGGTGSNAGSGSLTLTGQGFLKLAGNDSYTGGTTINSGVLSLPGLSSAGTGAITFANQGPSALVLGASPLQPGGALSNPVFGFSTQDVIDILSMSYTANATATLSGTTLSIASGGRAGTIALPDAASGTLFHVGQSQYGGIEISVVPH